MKKNLAAIDEKIATAEKQAEEAQKNVKELAAALEKVQADRSAGVLSRSARGPRPAWHAVCRAWEGCENHRATQRVVCSGWHRAD